MERRYLVATVALVATFAIFSREFRSGHFTHLPCSRAGLRAELACAKHYLADQLVAKARPFIARSVPEEQQMVAELNLPVLVAANEKVAELQAQVAQQTAQKNCESALRAQEQALRAREQAFRVQEQGLRAAERVQQRAAEISARAQERAEEINVRVALRAQEISARAVERAQRALQKSHPGMVLPNPPEAPLPPLPIDFKVNLPADFDQQVQAAVENHMVVKCVRTNVAARQYRTVIVHQANQNMMNNVQVVVSTQDVSGVSALAQAPASQSAVHKLGHTIQHLEDHIAASVDRAFATL